MGLLLLVDEESRGHDPGGGMPDRPARIDVCRTALEQAGFGLQVGGIQAAPRRDLEAAHDPAYLRRLEAFCQSGGGWIDPDTFAGPRSFQIAVQGAGSVCTAADSVLAGGPGAFCLTRPPGHHATRDRAMGFCLINHVAVGAAHALSAGARKVAILDIDVHHGNGTQEIFWTDDRVIYISVHQWPWYPWTSGDLTEIGEGQSEGLNVNIPLPEGCGDDVYEQVMTSVVDPVLRQSDPDLIIVSAGFDAHEADQLSLQRVTSAGFGRIALKIARLAKEVCEGRLVLALEGGYNLNALAESVVQTAKSLTGGSDPRAYPSPDPPALPDFLGPVLAFHSARWDLQVP